jgi:hypothetical protein
MVQGATALGRGGVEEWRKYNWSNKCTVELGAGKTREWVFRTLFQKWEKDFIQPYKKGKAATVMVWGAFGTGRRSRLVFMPVDPDSKRGGVTSAVYLEVLEDELPTFKRWFEEQGIVVVEWPPYSPDLNLIEHIWKHLKEWVHKHYPELPNPARKSQTPQKTTTSLSLPASPAHRTKSG